MKNLKTILQYTLILAIGAFFLYFVFRKTDWADMKEKFLLANYNWIALGMLVALFSHYLRALRAVMVYEALGFKIPVKNSLAAVLTGYMMNYFIPRAGELSRCAALNKTDHMPVDKSLGTVVAERAFDLLILLLLLALVFVFQFDMLQEFLSGREGATASAAAPLWQNPKIILLVFMLISAGSFYFFRRQLAKLPFMPKIIGLFKGFGEGLMSIRKVKRPFLFIVYSLAIWLCYVLMMYFCLFSMEATSHIGFGGCLTVFAIGTLGMLIPAPGAGAGTYHFAVMQSLKLYGVSEADGTAYATLVHGAQMILLLALGLIASIFILYSSKKQTHEPPGTDQA